MYNLKTGDLFLFHEKTSIFGKLIQYFTGSNYCHVGMILKDPTFTKTPLVGLFFWESSDENCLDVEDHQFKIGVEIVELEKMLDNSRNSVDLYYRKLHTSIPIAEEALKEIHDVVHNKPYDIVPKDWIEAYIGVDDEPQKTDRFWCSALVGYIYTKLGFLPPDTDWSIMRPSDFSSENKLELYNGAYLEDEILIENN